MHGDFGELRNVTVATHRNWFNNTTAVRITQQLDARKLAGHVVVTDEMLADSRITAVTLEAVFDKTFRPWRYPDRNPMPQFVLYPRLDAMQRALRQLRRKVTEWRTRNDD